MKFELPTILPYEKNKITAEEQDTEKLGKLFSARKGCQLVDENFWQHYAYQARRMCVTFDRYRTQNIYFSAIMNLVNLQYMLKYVREKSLYSNANAWAKTSFVTHDAIMDQLGSVFICVIISCHLL